MSLRIARIPRRQSETATEIHTRDSDANGLDAFAPESATRRDPSRGTAAPEPDPSPKPSAWPRVLRWAGVLLLCAGAAAAGVWIYQRTIAPAATLTVRTTPPGVRVAIAGGPSGTTPLTVSLKPGEYQVTLLAEDGERRDMVVNLTPGMSLIRDVELTRPAETAAAGALRVETDPPGQQVLVDGVEYGISPLTIPSLAAGEHAVLIRGAQTTIERTIEVMPGETSTLVVSPPAGATAGWLAVRSPIALQLRENGEVLGTTETTRLLLTAGVHQIDLVNEALGFHEVRRVTIAPGRTTTLRVEVPNGRLSINALPWAEVWVGGERVGETPIANLERPIGTHEVILRHPQYGERRTTLTVALDRTARLGVDMRLPQ